MRITNEHGGMIQNDLYRLMNSQPFEMHLIFGLVFTSFMHRYIIYYCLKEWSKFGFIYKAENMLKN